MVDASGPTVVEDEAGRQFRILVDGQVAGFADYTVDGATRAFAHTVVRPEFEGQGLGSTLVRAALDATRAAGHTVLPYCSFVRHFVARHAEYQDLVPVGRLADFGLPAPERP